MMNKKDAEVIKVLADLGLRKEPELTDDQLEMLKRAQHPEAFFLDDVEKLFKEKE